MLEDNYSVEDNDILITKIPIDVIYYKTYFANTSISYHVVSFRSSPFHSQKPVGNQRISILLLPDDRLDLTKGAEADGQDVGGSGDVPPAEVPRELCSWT